MLIITKPWGTQKKEDVTRAGYSHREEMEVARWSQLSSWHDLKVSPKCSAGEMAVQDAASPPSQRGLLIASATAWSKREPDVSASLDWTQQLDHGLQSAATLLDGTQAFLSRSQGAVSDGSGCLKDKKL